MGTLLVYTENYWQGVGAASFIADLTNGLADCFDGVVLASNPEGLPPDTVGRLTMPVSTETVSILTAASVWNDWNMVSYTATQVLVRLVRALDPVVFERNVALCRRLIRRVRPAAVLSYNGGYPAARTVLSMVVAARCERVPVALTVVSMPTARRPSLGWYEAWLDGRIGAAADAIVVNAHSIGAALVVLRDLPESRLRLVRNGLPDSPHRVAYRADGAIRIGCVSRFDALKGTVDLVNAFALVAANHPEVELYLVGDGPERAAVEEAVDRHALRRRVTLPGHYEGDIAQLVATFDIYAFPSLWEGLPYALLEALRAGCAIVTTDVGGIPEAVDDGVNGVLVPPASVDHMAAALERLVVDPERRQSLGAAGRRRFEKDFSLANTHRQIRQAFRSAGIV
jgi:glycosyltransferase involved in cell wall biosynthesis